MSPRNKETYDPEQMCVDCGNSVIACANTYQQERLNAALRSIQETVHDPEIGHLVWAYLSAFTPAGLAKDLREGKV